MPIEPKIRQYHSLLKSREILNQKIRTLEKEIIDSILIPGIHVFGDYEVELKTKTTTTLSVDKAEEIVQGNL